MRRARKILFWFHLAAGLLAGIVILVMCVTGAMLSFESNIIEFAEADVRTVTAEPSATRIGPGQALDTVTAAFSDKKASSISIKRDPGSAWQVSLGREGTVFVDPYTGDVLGESNTGVRSMMSSIRSWHRWLAMSGDQRYIGKAITGAANLLFLFLAVVGLYIWFPRNLSWKRVRPILWFRGGVRGKARNFNWHNTIGFWCAIFLAVFALTATVMSYQWANDLLYTFTGNEPPSAGRTAQKNEEKTEFVVPERLGDLWAAAESHSPEWKSISVRLPATSDGVSFTIDEGIYWNMFARSTLTLDAKTASVASWEPYSERNAGQQLRSWFRFLHTGESFGMLGQIIGFISCIGGAFLVWTGFSLSFRRFGNWFRRRRIAPLP